MFEVTDRPIAIEALSAELVNHAGGAFVAFEGRVRKQNDGRPVKRLDYELFPEMCIAEGERILAEAKRLFPILEVRAVHRFGTLELGESAVWVGVITSHRGAGFQACRFIIDSVKARCPIWKKETYADGPSEWVGCPSCETQVVSAPQVFSRQARLVGLAGQKALKEARVLVVGVGGLGCPSALNLAAAGVGYIRLIDQDRLDASNLHRQTLYSYQDVGSYKAMLAKRRLEELHPFTTIDAIADSLSLQNIEQHCQGIDLIVDCTDNFATKYLINDQAVLHRIPYVQASIYQNQAQLFSYRPGQSPCLRCIRPLQPPADCVESCTDSGILGAATSAVGSYQALEAMRLLLGTPSPALTSQIHFDLETFENFAVERTLDPQCPACSPLAKHSFIYQDEELYPQSEDEADYERLRELSDAIWVDIREEWEHDSVIPQAQNIPLSRFDSDALWAWRSRPVILFCQRGMRSRQLLKDLKALGHTNVKALKNGADALSLS
jgi:molybdopterin/thiamine biosynthesis adenylyltransferase/molybdopterin synthase catalytic subunit/rhodanese-related sulfurtransferase